MCFWCREYWILWRKDGLQVDAAWTALHQANQLYMTGLAAALLMESATEPFTCRWVHGHDYGSSKVER